MSSILFRLRHVKLAKTSMGLAPLLRDAADEIERLQRLLEERPAMSPCSTPFCTLLHGHDGPHTALG